MSEPQNFDEFYNGNRAFILGGHTFHWRPLHWREWGTNVDARVAEEEEREKKLRAAEEKLKKEGKDADLAFLEDEETLVENFEKVIERCSLYVEKNEVESFKATVNDPEKRITIAQLQALMVWLQEVQTPDRPTTTPSPSTPGRGKVGATSQAA